MQICEIISYLIDICHEKRIIVRYQYLLKKSILCISTMKAASWHRTTDTEIMRYVSQTSGIPACQRFANINNQYQVP